MLKALTLIGLTIAVLLPQNLDEWIGLAAQGKTDEVTARLSAIEKQYGTDPGLIYLRALLEPDGAKAVDLYKTLCRTHPENSYCPAAMLKISEYYYVSGLYLKSGDWLKKYLKTAGTHVPDKVRALNLLKRSLTISGNADSVDYYLSLYGDGASDAQPVIPVVPPPPPVQVDPFPESPAGSGRYAVQVGLFGSLENAGKRLKVLQDRGYEGRIQITIKDGKALHAVVIGAYDSDAQARKVSLKIKSELGLDSFVVEN